MIVTVQYTQLNKSSCLRETYHDGTLVSSETLEQRETPVQVQRLMLMNRADHDPTISELTTYSPQEIMMLVERS